MIISFFHLIRGRDRAGYFGTKYGKAKGRLCPWGLRGVFCSDYKKQKNLHVPSSYFSFPYHGYFKKSLSCRENKKGRVK